MREGNRLLPQLGSSTWRQSAKQIQLRAAGNTQEKD